MLFFNICLSSANLIHWVLFYLPFGYDSESITSFRVQCVIHLTNHLAEQTFFMGGFFICYSVRKCPEYYQQFLIYLISTRAFTTTFVLKNIQFLESLFWFYFNLAPHQSTRMKLCSCCQDNHCLFSGRGKKSKTCRMPVEFEPEGHSLWAHLVLPTRAGYSRKLRLQMSFHITTYNFFSGTGENAKGKFNMTVLCWSARRSSRCSSECCKTKASLHIITDYQYPRLITSFLCQFFSILIRRGD